jgi:TrmH family RNA methyltransferase
MTGLAFNNPKVQRLRRLIGRRRSRSEEGCFVVEGPILVSEAVAAGWPIEAQFVGAGERPVAGAGPSFELAEGVLERVASTGTPQSPLAIAASAYSAGPAPIDLETVSFVVVLDRVTDPGNLGTIHRSAEAAGVELVVATPGSTDPFGPKAVRASAGALFHVAVATHTLAEVAEAGLRLIGTSSHTTPDRCVQPHTEIDWTGRVAIVLGNEASGLAHGSTDDVDPIAEWVTIEHLGRSESLNVAMAATVLVFEAARHRGGR